MPRVTGSDSRRRRKAGWKSTDDNGGERQTRSTDKAIELFSDIGRPASTMEASDLARPYKSLRQPGREPSLDSALPCIEGCNDAYWLDFRAPVPGSVDHFAFGGP